MIGGIIAIAPDFDILYMYIKEGRIYANHHQFLTHRPTIILPLAWVFGLLIGGHFWAITALCCLAWHYQHDNEIDWFWPVSQKYYSPEKSLTEEQKFEKWLAENWLVPNPRAVVEIFTGCLFLMIVAVGIGHWRVGAAFVIAIWLGAILLWSQPEK
ncbi:MAG: hypothetical protein AAB474_01590 [Patescibacteria group bacterium]